MKWTSRTVAATGAIAVVGLGLFFAGQRLLGADRGSPVEVFRTADQQGRRYFEKADYGQAATVFQDPMWKGTAWYRDGEFEKAAGAFSRRDTAEAHYNRGNALLMHGDYPGAIASYDRALEKRADWKAAVENREIAVVRGERTKAEGGDMGDQTLGADEVVFDADAKNEGGQDTQIVGGTTLSEQDVQALWLRRVQTRPANFLKAKFAYQQAMRREDGS